MPIFGYIGQLWQKLFVVLFAIILLFLSVKIKTPGVEALRPLHYPGIFVLFLGAILSMLTFLSVAQRVRLTRAGWGIIIWLGAIYGYIFTETLSMPVRALKDFLIGSAVDLGCMAVLLGYCLHRHIMGKDSVRPIAWMFLLFAAISAGMAWFMYFDIIKIKIIGHELAHNPAWGVRIHGWFGEPTHLGTAAGIGILIALYLLGTAQNRLHERIFLFAVSVVLGSAIYGTGSRNGVLSAAVGVVLLFMFLKAGRRQIVLGAFGAVFGGVLLMTVMVNFFAPNPNVAAAVLISRENPVASAVEQKVANTVEPKVANTVEQKVVSAVKYMVLSGAEYIKYGFRINDYAGATSRLGRFENAYRVYMRADLRGKLLGGGYGSLRKGYGSAMNDYLESLVDFGAIFVVILLGYFSYLGIFFLRIIKNDNGARAQVAIFGLILLSFGGVFALNMSSFFTCFFHLASFTHILACVFAIELCVTARPMT